MSAWSDAEEADAWAVEQARVAAWAAEHEHPVTVALHRAEKAEAQLADLASQRGPQQNSTGRSYIQIHTTPPEPSTRLVPVNVPCPRCGWR
ncbi:hypothetical protein [Janibacter sp. GS2]|uniref:hypothetical protein n=1 Tax=Janibacter sp. GS2 TaxID=3442646 RepID=UPI003EBF594D